MAAGPQKLKRRPPADDHTLDDDDGVVTIKRPDEGQFEANLEATIQALQNVTSNDDNSNASIQPYQTIGTGAEDNAHRGNSGESDNEDHEYVQNAQRVSDVRLDSSPGSHRTPEHETQSVQNPGNTGRLDNQVENRRNTYAYHEAPSFREMAPDFARRSPSTQRRMCEELDNEMSKFAQKQLKEKIELQKDWADRVLQKDQELRIMREEMKRLRASHGTLIKSAKTPSNSRDNSPAAQAVRPKVNVQRQSRPRSRDRATRSNTQVSFRRSRRQTSFDASSSDNDGNSRGFLRRNNRTSSPQGAVR